MTDKFDTIVIGGGIVGCGVLYGLAERGVTNTLLLEKNELTSGSTWHAAGNCTHFGHDAEITRLYVDSIKTYLRAEAESGHSIDFHKTGSLRLANTAEELAAYHRLTPIYEKLNIPYKVVSTDEISRIHPLMNLEGVLGAAIHLMMGMLIRREQLWLWRMPRKLWGQKYYANTPLMHFRKQQRVTGK